ncbi:ABC transporter [Serendipita vermifera]|nr:ABC transporter [Serendipita vermifera]
MSTDHPHNSPLPITPGTGVVDDPPKIIPDENTCLSEKSGVPSANKSEITQGMLAKSGTKKSLDDVQHSEADKDAIGRSDLLTGTRLAVVWTAFLLSVLLVALDNTIVSTALPKLASHFNALEELTWVATAYLLTQAGSMLIYGQILTILPTKWVYLTTIFVFELGSLICAVAPSMNVLILGRAIAGTGGGGIFTSILTVVAYATKLEQRPILFGTLGAVYQVASIVGPLIGGALTDKVSWRWCFYINLPLGAISILSIGLLLPAHDAIESSLYEGKSTFQKLLAMDWLGGFLSLAAITTLLLPLQWGGNTRSWNDPSVIALLATFGALLIAFLLWEWKMQKYAIVPLYTFKNRTQVGAVIELFLIYFTFLLATIYLPFLYQAKGRSAVQSGIDIIPFSVSVIVGTTLSAAVVKFTGRYKVSLVAGPWFSAIAGGLFYTIDAHTSNAKLIGYQIILGFGCGSSFQNTLIAIQAEYDSKPALIPQASAIAAFLQLVGGTLGIAVGGTLFANELTRNLGPLVAQISPELVKGVRQSVTVIFSLPKELWEPVVDAYVAALATMFIINVPVLALAGIFGLIVRDWNLKKKNGEKGAATA